MNDSHTQAETHSEIHREESAFHCWWTMFILCETKKLHPFYFLN